MTNNNKIKLALLQLQFSKDPKKNLSKIIEQISKATHKGANVVLLPELHQYNYFCQTHDEKNFSLAEKIPGPTTTILSDLAQKLQIIIVASLFEKGSSEKFYNTCIVINEKGELLDQYRKIHIPDDPNFHEKYYFTPGDLGFKVVNTIFGKIGLLICWDQWFPEAARILALKGADYIVIPTAIGWLPSETKKDHERQLDAWITIQKSHAIANGLPLAVCNRVGFEPHPKHNDDGIIFWGNSFICDAFGEILISGSTEKENSLVQEINLSENEKIREIWPFFRDRRTKLYGEIVK